LTSCSDLQADCSSYAGRADAVLAASIFHFGTHRIADVKRQMQRAGIAVRMEHADYDDVL